MNYSRVVLGAGIVALLVSLFSLAQMPAHAQDDDPPDPVLEHGEYLVTIAGCIGCHTPNNSTGRLDRLRLLSGGREFDLGPLGILVSRNLTPDEGTGLGTWTDEEIKMSITTGITPEGDQLFYTMPYPYFNNMAEDDLDAIVAYLRSVRPVENDTEHEQFRPSDELPHLTRVVRSEPAPDPADTIARGNYLFTAILACSDCHTPFDPQTRLPDDAMYMAGGQSFEGEWGMVYSGNITPDDETGIGTWSDADIKHLLTTGVRPDGRRIVSMPWEDYSVLTDDDLNAIIYYLRVEVEPIDHSVPKASLDDDYIDFVELPSQEPVSPNSQQNLLIIAMLVGGLIGLFIAGSLYANRQRQQPWS